MRVAFDDGTLVLENAPESVPHAEWDDRVVEYRGQAHRYRDILEWTGHNTISSQVTLHSGAYTVEPLRMRPAHTLT